MVQKVPNLRFKTTSAHPVKAAMPAANRLFPVLLVTGMAFDGVEAATAVNAVVLLLAAMGVEEELKTILRQEDDDDDDDEEEEDDRLSGGEKAIETSTPHRVANTTATTIIVTALRTRRPGFRRTRMFLLNWLGAGSMIQISREVRRW